MKLYQIQVNSKVIQLYIHIFLYIFNILVPYACMHAESLQSYPTLQPWGLQPTRLLCPCDSPGKNTGVGCHSLLQGIVSTQELNSGLLHCGQILYCLSHQANLKLFKFFFPELFSFLLKSNYIYISTFYLVPAH